MIVVDEAISNERIISAIASWYPGAVISARDLRPNTRLFDYEIPRYLMRFKRPTFITHNYTDWNKSQLAHKAYCIIAFRLTNDEALRIPALLREILRQPDYRTKRKRCGKVICWTEQGLFHYEA
jgi:hypothetical protein